MPPRLPTTSAMRITTPTNSLLRAFSSTPSVDKPPRTHTPHAAAPSSSTSSNTSQSSQPSSTASLLSIDKDRSPNANRGGAGNHSQNRPAVMTRGAAAERMMKRYKDRGAAASAAKQEQLETLRSRKLSSDYLRQMPRRWEAGDVYSPHDLSPIEMQKFRTRSQRKADVVDALAIRPLDMYKNFSLTREFTSSSGQITHSSGTGLRPVNQRKIAKMIRRVQGMGIYPTIHDHPEMIRAEFFNERENK